MLNQERKHIRVAFDTLGCKLNQAETELLARQFAEAGYRLVSPSERTDVYILNTCTVTHIADRKARHLLRMAHRRNPDALVVATGCYIERTRQELSQLGGVDFVLDNKEKPYLLRILEESGRMPSHSSAADSMSDHSFRTRAFIKVQDGCNCSCAYCIVPLVRGKEKSVPLDQVLDEVSQRAGEGYKEAVLTGTEVGTYECNGVGLKGLLEHVLAQTSIRKVRLSSLQPQEISLELIALWQDRRLCRHFHLSLQSGSDAVLRRMKRRYSAAEYQRAVSLIRSALPEAAITTDVIVGFPGETAEEFEESYDFCRQTGFSRIHVFTFSPRPRTEAARMFGQVKPQAKKERSERMLALAEESARRFRGQFLDKTMPVLWEQQADDTWSGFTDNYIKVYAKSNQDLTNRLLQAKLLDFRGDGLWGEVEYNQEEQ